jgi:hypothetical protein
MLVEVAWHYYEHSPGVSDVIATRQDQLPKAVADSPGPRSCGCTPSSSDCWLDA